ncbi:RidA family protein [Sphingosinicella xenopeptidilytica]|uniref:RidA family protein n=1 Tax=Sphingosinicella xenopeptidilytica TaxID=364098 RepID=A0ABW3C7I6_SPHXN
MSSSITRTVPEVGYLDREIHETFGFAQMVRTGPFVHISGIAPVTGSLTTLRLVGNTATEQLQFILDIMRKLLASEGLKPDSLASWTIYCIDTPAVLEAMPSVRDFVGDHWPASTLLGVTSLFVPGQLVEISALAYDAGFPATR